MKVSTLAILTAATLVLTSPAFAQLQLDLGLDASGNASSSTDDDSLTTSSTGAAGADATAGASVDGEDGTATADVVLGYDVNANGTLEAEELAAIEAALASAGRANFSIDADNDGRLSAEEAASLSAALSGTVSIDDVFDTDDDGTISPDEQDAAVALLSSGGFDCSASGLESVVALTATFDAAAVAAATNANVVVIAECEASDITAALASSGAATARSTLDDNDIVMAAIQAQGYQLDDVLGATVSGDTVTVYVVTTQA